MSNGSVNFLNFPGVALPLLQQILSAIGTPSTPGETIFSLLEKIMSADTDLMAIATQLQADDAAVQAAVTANTAAINTAIALIGSLQTGSVPAADVESVVTMLKTVDSDLQTASGGLKTSTGNLNTAATPPGP